MGQIRPLRKETTPIEGESARGLFCRALGDHGVPLSFTVLRRLGMLHRNVVTISEDAHLDVAEMARVIRVDPMEIEKRRYAPLGRKHYSFFGLDVPSSAIEKKVRRFAPASLRKSLHIRATWELSDLSFCPETWDLLVDSCVCRIRQGWIRLNGVHRCDDCGRELSRVPTDSVPTEMREALSFVAGIANPVTSERTAAIAMLPAPLRGADRSAIYNCIMLLRRTGAGDGASATADLVALHRACAALLSWPSGAAGLEPAEGVTPATWRRAIKAYADLVPSPTKTAPRTVPEPTPSASDGEATLIGIRPAYELAKLTLETMMAGRECGHLPRHEKLRAGRLIPAFKPEEVTAFAEAYRARIGPDVVGYGVGLGRRAVCEIAALGHMTASGMSLRDHETWFTNRDIDAFRTTVVGKQRATLHNPILLRHAMMAISGRPKPWGSVVGAMLHGPLPFHVQPGRAPLFDRVCIERADIAVIAAHPPATLVDPRVGNRVTQGEALEILNAKATCRALSKLRSVGTNPAFYDLDDVVALAARGATVLEVAKTTGRTFSSTYAQIARAGVDAIADGLWDRRQVAELFGI